MRGVRLRKVYYGIGKRRVIHFRPQMELSCVVCQMSDQDARLNKCPICFRWVCDNCEEAVRRFDIEQQQEAYLKARGLWTEPTETDTERF